MKVMLISSAIRDLSEEKLWSIRADFDFCLDKRILRYRFHRSWTAIHHLKLGLSFIPVPQRA